MTTTTDENGYYTFTNLPNGSYTITPSKTGYEFTPPSRTVTIIDTNTIRQDFEAVGIGAEERILIALPETTAAPGESITVPVNITDAMGVSGAHIVVT